MSLVEGVSKDTAIAAVDELAKKFDPELFAKTFAAELAANIGQLFAGKTLTITMKLGD